ncbi:hypothetical protein [Arenimonas caeni]|jgi:hypothetical protein|uniref:Lipoprotein n=1 Tax=Arenimonas caeni TaxID=2058085 RepID=A0A2P6M693_9GAMM|nr:hypothetical protein [Arenimonas caeni]MDY0021715.1 hypothetical protein [Arenimonas caeni]PRH81445.1 hypothetical protein C6N40_12675 [Arenimonas caeni]
MKTPIATLALLLLTGCQATFWARPPMPGGGCDPATRGQWVTPAGEDPQEERMRLSVDADCSLVAEKFRGNETTSRSGSTLVRMARLGDQPYAWLDANTLLAYEGVSHRTGSGDVMVFRYRVEGNRLRIWNANHLHVRALISDGRIRGGFDDNDEDEFNRITGAVPPALLSAPDFFEPTPMELVREGGRP